MTMRADVVIVGAGMAGLCAAIAALESGADVLVIEKGTRPGGSMALSHGLIWTFADKAQLREEIPDGNDALQDFIVDELCDAFPWLERQGVRLSEETDFQWYGSGRRSEPAQMADALTERISALGGRVHLETSLQDLETRGGRITGLRAVSSDSTAIDIEARAVVLATGGFQGNPELLTRYVTPHAGCLYLRANPWSTGDGFLAATEAGAAVTPWLDTFYGHALAAPPAQFNQFEFYKVTQRYGPTAVALNLRGQRFVDESAGTGEEALNCAMAHEPFASAIYVIDATTAELRSDGGSIPRVSIERARECGAPIKTAATLTELAEALYEWGVPPAAALRTLEDYNAAVAAGEAQLLDPPRRKNPLPLRDAPFTAVRVRSAITFTCGGLQVDMDMRVLRRAATISTLPLVTVATQDVLYAAFDNLYAAGCDIGGVHNIGYMGGLATALVTGWTAGRSAVAASSRATVSPRS